MKSHLDADSAVLRQSSGPLSVYIPDFGASLESRGYATTYIAYRLRLARALDRWMRQSRMRVEDFDEERIQQFLRYRKKRYVVDGADPRALHSLLKYLRDANVVPSPVSQPEMSPLDHLQARFAQYLAEQRGLEPSTVKRCLFYSRRFLLGRFGNGALSLRELNTRDISRCVLHQARTVSPYTAQQMAKTLRNLFRFLHQRGDIATDLAEAVPTVANWRLAGLPKHLSAEQIELVLRTCDEDSPAGQRNQAILLLLARLGLRASEIVHMTLEDINWEAGELTIRGKGGRQDGLPLPRDVGHSLAKYLRRVRPRCACRRVFLCLNAPYQGMRGSSLVDYIVNQALRRAGLNPHPGGAHILRHSLATAMLRRGASLPEIGEILRHQLANTTAIYAKVDLAALRTLAQPWPGGVK